nr:hypothetical protein [uncultured Marinifilum sp.]
MKYINLLIVCLFLVVFNACDSNDSTDQTKSMDLLSVHDINSVGVEHNNALDKVLQGLKDESVSFEKNRTNIEVLLNAELNEYYEMSNFLAKESSIAIKQSRIEVERYIDGINKNKLKNSEEYSSIQIAIEEYDEDLTEKQCKLLLKIDYILG